MEVKIESWDPDENYKLGDLVLCWNRIYVLDLHPINEDENLLPIPLISSRDGRLHSLDFKLFESLNKIEAYKDKFSLLDSKFIWRKL